MCIRVIIFPKNGNIPVQYKDNIFKNYNGEDIKTTATAKGGNSRF